MNLADLFRVYRKSEPSSLLGLKLFTMIILIASVAGYLVVVVIDVRQDVPITITSLMYADSIRAPNVVFSCDYKFNLTCKEIRTGDVFIDCSSDIVKSEKGDSYLGVYRPLRDVIFEKGGNSLFSVSLHFTIDDDNYTPEKRAAIVIMAVDSEHDPYEHTDSTYNAFNTYLLSLNQNYELLYSRKIDELIIPNWTNDFGIPLSYEKRSNILSDLHNSYSIKTNDLVNVLEFDIRPKNLVVQVDREVRSRTFLNGLGLIGGAWGLAAALYGLLFGADILRPWGIIQSYCCGLSRSARKKLKETLPTIPFYDTQDPDIKNLSLAEQNKLRILGLELFLKEYVVDVNYLDGIRDKTDKEVPTNNLNNQAINGGFGNNLNTSSMYPTVTTIPPRNHLSMPPNFTQSSIAPNNFNFSQGSTNPPNNFNQGSTNATNNYTQSSTTLPNNFAQSTQSSTYNFNQGSTPPNNFNQGSTPPNNYTQSSTISPSNFVQNSTSIPNNSTSTKAFVDTFAGTHNTLYVDSLRKQALRPQQ